jgi:hypothetical protein
MAENDAVEKEIEALSVVYRALSSLESDAQSRVIAYVTHKLRGTAPTQHEMVEVEKPIQTRTDSQIDPDTNDQRHNEEQDEPSELDGISPVARKWMLRNSLSAEKLSVVFSLGADEIDLIAKSVPGENTKEKMRSIFLLEGIAAYLATGASRFTHEKVREACLHYKAFDTKNFAAYFKSLNSEISGSSKAGYALTTRGMSNATELLKQMK